MKKASIFLVAFLVSFMVIYSVYYYSKIKGLDRGVVASANELPHTVIGYEAAHQAVNGQTGIYELGLFQALNHAIPDSNTWQMREQAQLFPLPGTNFLSIDTPYNRNSLEKLDERILIKFKKHPPIDFDSIAKGDSLLFSYFFRNIGLPYGFRRSAEGVTYRGHSYQALEYYPFDKAHTNASVYYASADAGHAMLKIDLPDANEEAILVNALTPGDAMENYKQAEALIQAGKYTPYSFKQNEALIIPDLDFSIVKHYRPGELSAFGNAFKRYKVIEERVKFKLSIPEGQNQQIKHGKDFKTYRIEGRCLFYLKKKNSAEPYFMVLIDNPEILPAAYLQ